MSTKSTSVACQSWTAVLRTWAGLGERLADSYSQPAHNWNAVQNMIDAARPKLAAEAEKLKMLLIASRKTLVPLEEPLDLDLGLHRWLKAEREEAYSDWLEWVVKQAGTANQVFQLFRLGPAPPELIHSASFAVQRECCIPHGHADQQGRLDLVIRFGNQAIIVVEVKTTEAESADVAKHEGYARWLNQQSQPCKRAVLLAISGDEETYFDFHFRSWACVAIEMRRLAIVLREEERMMAAALVLAFAAAVEQNLLGFSTELVRSICSGRMPWFNPSVVDHLEAIRKVIFRKYQR